ncbi:MAG: DNA-protecting protein DprA [Planctomycetia bacterium]|nr:DNA-protecting protein DprA [Planctomycetia bacterium]
MFTSPEHDRLRDHVRLACLPGVGSRYRKLLLERFGSPAGIFSARPDELRSIAKIGKKLAEAIPTLVRDRTADDTLDLCAKHSIDVILEGSPHYPGLLSRIDDPPGLLFVHGSLVPADALAVAVVGARHATPYGLKIAEQLGGSLARAGYTVVSGLARGIDAAAHRGALAAGGRTIAVLGTGVLNVYPPENAELALDVIRSGALLSEEPPLAEAHPGLFPRRNRIVSGLSLGVVVVEASDRSGALITARLAGEQGREVFAVPGPIDSRMSRGCHALIRDGATLVGGIDDILAEFGPLFETATTAGGRAVSHPAELQLGDLERRVLDAVGSTGATVDEIVEATGMAASQALAAVSVLEVRRLVRRLPGSRIERP